jgi:outer membrane lipoprotein SlyB
VDPRTRNVFIIGLLALVVVLGGAAVLLGGAPGRATSATAPSVVGVIVGIESEGLDRVREFSLRADDGGTLAFTLGNLENGAAFPPGHLAEHQATAQPVRVWYVEEGGTRVAIRIDDAS